MSSAYFVQIPIKKKKKNLLFACVNRPVTVVYKCFVRLDQPDWTDEFGPLGTQKYYSGCYYVIFYVIVNNYSL